MPRSGLLIWLWWYHEVAYGHGIYIYIQLYMMMRWHEIMVLRWWLCSTTGPLWMDLFRGRIWKDYDSFHRGCFGKYLLERVVGMPSWCITAWSTYPGQHQCWALYMIFFGFHDIKSICIMFTKSICIIKGTLMVSYFVLIQRFQRKFSTSPWALKER